MRQVASEPRDRILGTAARLFHRHGIGATGIDRVTAAGVAKATFHRQFPSKEELVLAWIRDPATRWFDRLFERAKRRSEAPARVIPAIFDEVADWLERDGYRGCPYLHLAAALESIHAVTDAVVTAREAALSVARGEPNVTQRQSWSG